MIFHTLIVLLIAHTFYTRCALHETFAKYPHYAKVTPINAMVSGIAHILPYIQIVLAVFLVTSILLQKTGASVGGAFGGGDFSSAFHTRRGLEKTLFNLTIVLGILFALSALISLI